MSEPGWTTGAAPTPDDRDEAQPLTYSPAGSTEGEGEGDAEEGPDGDDPTADPRPRGGLRLNREGRLGLAAALSFLIVVAVLIVNRWRSKTADAGAEPGKKPPVLAAAGLIRPEPDAKPEPATAPVPVAAQDSPPAPGAFPPLTGDPAKDGDPGEHVQ